MFATTSLKGRGIYFVISFCQFNSFLMAAKRRFTIQGIGIVRSFFKILHIFRFFEVMSNEFNNGCIVKIATRERE